MVFPSRSGKGLDPEVLERCQKRWKPEASLECRHPVYENVMVLAVTCDGKVECYNKVDEKSCRRNDIYIVLGEDQVFVTGGLIFISFEHYRSIC